MSRLKRINLKLPARASVWYLGASATAKAVGFLITPFFTRMISGQAYGELTLYLTLLGIATVCCSAVNSGSAIYKGISENRNDKGSYLRSALLVSLSFSAIICILLFALWPFFDLPTHLIIPLFLQIVCDGTVAVASSSAKYSYRYKEVALMSVSSSVLPSVITLALLKTVGGRFRIRVYALLAISMCLAVYSLVKILKNGGRASRKMAGELLKTASPLIPQDN